MFELVSKGGEDTSLPYTDGSNGPYLALGDIVCAERYILMHAHVCNRSLQRAPLNLPEMFEFPHVTLAKLELGYSLRRANSTIWVPEVQADADEFDISRVLRFLNQELRWDATMFRLHPAHLEHNWYGHRYDITGGEARLVFRRVQGRLRQLCAPLGQCVGYWAEEPAHPHITFERPQDEQEAEDWRAESSDEEVAGGQASPESSRLSEASSFKAVLEKLMQRRLGRLRPIFERERLTATVLPALTDEQLQTIGIASLGDRQKVLAIAAELATEGKAS